MSGSLRSILRAFSGLLGFLMLGGPESCISEGCFRVVRRSFRKLSKATRGQSQIFRLSKKSFTQFLKYVVCVTGKDLGSLRGDLEEVFEYETSSLETFKIIRHGASGENGWGT